MNMHLLRLRLLAFVTFGIASLSASAQVYKCVDTAGKTAYQSRPCPENPKSVELAIRESTSVPTISGTNFSMASLKQEMMNQCMGTRGGSSASGLGKLAKDQPQKFQSFCQCAADTVAADMATVKDLIAKRDQEGMRQLGIKAGLSCASRLK